MKFLVVLAAVVALSAEYSVPLVPCDNSHYVEGGSYVWMPNDEDKLHLVDLEEPVDYSAETRNGANNQYWLYTRQNPSNAQTITLNNVNSIWGSNYLGSRPIVVYVHGWKNNGNSHPIIREAILAQSDANVIVVDWRALASASYTTAAAGVPSVGQHVGTFLTWLINSAGGNWNNVHLVGFSLGAHVVGVAGRQTGGRPARVTGLDPAYPGWEGSSNAISINAGQYVEIIHTDGNILGLFHPVGHADFYPNGGTNPQPGCRISDCSHGRAVEFFASSVRTNHFVGRACPNVWEANLGTCSGSSLNMGNNILTKRGSGIYHLRTGNSWPF